MRTNPCGCVYRAEMNKAYSITSMNAIICGEQVLSGDGSFLACSNDTFANPTSVYKMPDNDILLISEDTQWHDTNYLWAYDIGSGSLTRVLSTPYGGGVGAVSMAQNYNGFDYILTSIMHPYKGYEDRANGPLSIGQVGGGQLAGLSCRELMLLLLAALPQLFRRFLAAASMHRPSPSWQPGHCTLTMSPLPQCRRWLPVSTQHYVQQLLHLHPHLDPQTPPPASTHPASTHTLLQVGMVGYIGPIKKPADASTTLLADIAPPTTSAEKTQVLASGKVAFGSGLGAGQYVIYTPIVRDGDPMLPASAVQPALGSILNREGAAVAVVDLASLQQQPGSQLVSSNPAAASIIQLSVEGLFGVVQYRETPSTQYALQLQQTCYGDLVPSATSVLDWSSLGGLWGSSQAVTTPWNTQLGGEGIEPDARAFMSASKKGDVYGFEPSVVLFMRYFDKYIPGMTVDDVTTSIKPYRYGFATETAVNADGTAALNKRLAMGRFAHEGFAVMPDARTVVMTEQRHNGGLYMFVADKANDLSSGTLYAAKLQQLDDSQGGLFKVSWIRLAKAAESDISSSLATAKFDDIFDVVVLATGDNVCPDATFKPVATDFGVECLKLKKGMQVAAALLETHRYAALLNATMEWEDLGGLALDAVRNELHLAVGSVQGAMMDDVGVWDVTTSNDIRLAYNPCGCVYSMEIDASNMTGTLLRATKCGSLDPKDAMMQTCSAGSISNPQALVYVQGSSAIGGDLLLIYEASERKAVNMVWSWDLLSRQLIPVFHGPYDAKLGGAAFHPDINGYAYIGVSVMSPYAKHEDLAGAEETSGTNSWWGTIGPIQVSCWGTA